MPTPKSYALWIYRGDSYRWQFSLWTDPAQTDPVDLTAVTVAAEIRQNGTVTPLALTVAANVITLTLAAPASQQLAIEAGRWDLQLTYPSGDVHTIVAGTVKLTADVTGSTEEPR